MLTLALENSSARSSLALFRDHELLASEKFIADRRSQGVFFDLIDRTLKEQGINCADIGQYVVGRGPGNYTGMRTTFAMAQALALPSDARVIAVSSGVALALEFMSRDECPRVMVAGDARRGMFWAGIFGRAGEPIAIERDWELLSGDGLRGVLDDDVAIISPEMERLAEKLPLLDACGPRMVATPLYPDAEYLARIAFARNEQRIAQEPLEPLYMHPAVQT